MIPKPVPDPNTLHSQPTKRATVLVVDDSLANRSLMTAILKIENMKVVTAADGEQALACVKEKHFDLILLDVMMENMNGFEVLQRIKSDPTTSNIPVIMVTALDDRESMNRAREAGADDILIKPVHLADALARIKRVLQSLRSDALDDDTPVSEKGENNG